MGDKDFKKIFEDITNLKVGVLGDLMLDTYWWGHVERISPEAPVPVVAVDSREQRIGGAGNVALNVVSLQAQVSVLSTIGQDADGRELMGLLDDKGINTQFVLQSSDRITTNKIRIISRNQHMMRLDAEVTNMLSASEEDALYANCEKFIEEVKPHLLILEDYNKGVLTESLIQKVIALCKASNVITAVDPKRKNFFSYRGVDIFKPNLKEAREGLNIISEEVTEQGLREIHDALYKELQHNNSFITLSEKGVYYENASEYKLLPTHIRKIADVSGAGDTVIAVASLVYAATKDVALMAEVANIAGGLVCEEVGTVAINREKLLAECEELLG